VFLSFPTWHHVDDYFYSETDAVKNYRYTTLASFTAKGVPTRRISIDVFDIGPFRDQPHRLNVKQAVLLQIKPAYACKCTNRRPPSAETRIPDGSEKDLARSKRGAYCLTVPIQTAAPLRSISMVTSTVLTKGL
jgi:hypothetical protein